MKRVLIYYTEIHSSVGGSDYLPLLFIAELQKSYEVTLALNWKSDLDSASKMTGIPIDTSKLKTVLIKPRNNLLRKLDSILPFYRVWQLKKLAKDADACISTANMIDFGKPAHHVVYLMRLFGDNAFFDFVMHRKPQNGFTRFKQKLRTFLAETVLRPILGVRSTRKILTDPREHIYVPSRYVAETMRSFYGPFNCTVFYPPTLFEIPLAGVPRDPLRVVYLGRIIPEKGIDAIIEIVERARQDSGIPLSLHLAGYLPDTTYVASLKKSAAEKTWIKLVGPVYGNEKGQFLLSGTYAVHARRDEEFGISITEYLKAGCIPIVPDEGGSAEVVNEPVLTYHTNEEAARILTRLLADEAFRQKQLNHCRERAGEFSFERYMEHQHAILDSMLGELDVRDSNADPAVSVGKTNTKE